MGSMAGQGGVGCPGIGSARLLMGSPDGIPLHLATTDCGEVVNPETPLVLPGLLCARGTYRTQKEFSRLHTKLWPLIY